MLFLGFRRQYQLSLSLRDRDDQQEPDTYLFSFLFDKSCTMIPSGAKTIDTCLQYRNSINNTCVSLAVGFDLRSGDGRLAALCCPRQPIHYRSGSNPFLI